MWAKAEQLLWSQWWKTGVNVRGDRHNLFWYPWHRSCRNSIPNNICDQLFILMPPVILHIPQIPSPSWQENQLIKKMELPNFLPHYLRLIIEMWNDLLYFSSKTEDASWLSGLNSHYIIFPFAKVRVKPGGFFFFRKSSLQIKWDSFGVKEGRGRKGKKKPHDLFSGKSPILRWYNWG